MRFFFVDLPATPIRRNIFEIHLKKRKFDTKNFNLNSLADATDGFSGAEIEQAVISALYGCFSKDMSLSTESLLEEIRNTRPLSVIMESKITALRKWALDRTVNADG